MFKTNLDGNELESSAMLIKTFHYPYCINISRYSWAILAHTTFFKRDRRGFERDVTQNVLLRFVIGNYVEYLRNEHFMKKYHILYAASKLFYFCFENFLNREIFLSRRSSLIMWSEYEKSFLLFFLSLHYT